MKAHEESREACSAGERALASAEIAVRTAEAEQAEEKRRRMEYKADAGEARAALKPAKAAEKDAACGRTALLGHYSKAERGSVKTELEASVSSAKEAMNAVQ